MLRLSKEIYNQIHLSDPIVLVLSLLNIKGANLKRHPEANPKLDRIYAWPDSDLALDPITIDSIDYPDSAAKRLLDRLWQAFGFEEAPLFNEERIFMP